MACLSSTCKDRCSQGPDFGQRPLYTHRDSGPGCLISQMLGPSTVTQSHLSSVLTSLNNDTWPLAWRNQEEETRSWRDLEGHLMPRAAVPHISVQICTEYPGRMSDRVGSPGNGDSFASGHFQHRCHLSVAVIAHHDQDDLRLTEGFTWAYGSRRTGVHHGGEA